MNYSLTDVLNARLVAVADRLNLPPEELVEWLLADSLTRIESRRLAALPLVPDDALKAKIEATPLLVVEDMSRTIRDGFRNR